MEWNEQQQDSLAELVNIAFARTANSLSDLTGRHVSIGVPAVTVLPIKELFSRLGSLMKDKTATVKQGFSGTLSGDALLLMDYNSAITLTGLMMDDLGITELLDTATREVMIEIGNILINACLGMFGNMLEIDFSFQPPTIYLEPIDKLESIVSAKQELNHALLISTSFRLREDIPVGYIIQDSKVMGYLIIVMGISKLNNLLEAIKLWEPLKT